MVNPTWSKAKKGGGQPLPARAFEGCPPELAGRPLEVAGNPFELRVWRALQDIPYGHTTSYGAVAAAIGAPDAPRAVGLAKERALRPRPTWGGEPLLGLHR